MHPIRIAAITALLGVSATASARAQAVAQADVVLQTMSVVRRPAKVLPVRPTRPPLGDPRTPALTPVPAPAPAPTDIDVQVTVFSYHDDDAHGAMLRVFLPPETQATAMSAGCTAGGIAGSPIHAYVTCSLGQMAVNATRVIMLTFSAPPSHVVARVGAFAWSDTSDPNTGNNYMERVAP